MVNSRDNTALESEKRLERFRTNLDEGRLSSAPSETRLVVPHYRDMLTIARAELAELEAKIASRPVGEADRLKWKAEELRKVIRTLWMTVGPFQLH